MTPLFAGEGSEEIGNMIENYIKEIEELRYFITKLMLRKIFQRSECLTFISLYEEHVAFSLRSLWPS